MNKLIEQLKEHEGFRGNYYQCTANKKTIGHGRCVDNKPFTRKEVIFLGRVNFDRKPMTEDEAEYILSNDIQDAFGNLYGFVFWHELNEPRQAVLVNMVFNLGYEGFKKFKKTIKAISDLDYEKACMEMMDSKWAVQVGSRAVTLSEQMRTGEWQ